MSLRVLYVEDDEHEMNMLRDAVDSANVGRPRWSHVHLASVPHPAVLAGGLREHHPDVVLADVFFPPAGGSAQADDTDQLDQIVKEVGAWDRESPHGFPTPVIAYTGKGPDALTACLKRRGDLYDIWDKLSAGTEYVAWRFQRLAAELPRHRPDAAIQKLIVGMNRTVCPKWHEQVLALVRRYGEGQSEREQVENCRGPLDNILDAAAGKNRRALMPLWEVLAASEPLLRAVAPNVRGIARHSINVFWLGYWLINHPLLRDRMSTLWSDMLSSRVDPRVLSGVDPADALNRVWVLTSLLHDAGKFHEHSKSINDASEGFFKEFGSLETGTLSWNAGKPDALPRAVHQVVSNFAKGDDDSLTTALKAHILDCSQRDKPDHGAVAAAYLLSLGKDDPTFSEYAAEAARAILLHSCLPSVFDAIPKSKHASCPKLEWERDALTGLLLFCDQIQTWDRHDTTKEKQDYPDRAELSYLEAEPAGADGKVRVRGCIDYIAPSRVDMYPKLREDITEALNRVILEKPKDTLLHVLREGQWPFSVHLDCALSGDKLGIEMDFV